MIALEEFKVPLSNLYCPALEKVAGFFIVHIKKPLDISGFKDLCFRKIKQRVVAVSESSPETIQETP